MAKLAAKLAKKLDFKSRDDIAYGCINGIYVCVKLNRAPKRDTFESLIDKLTEIKYDSANIDIFVNRRDGIDLKDISKLFEENYWVYKASKFQSTDSGFFLFLYKNDSVNIKASYIVNFLNYITDYLNANSYYSACSICGSNDNLSCLDIDGAIKVRCLNCQLKDSSM